MKRGLVNTKSTLYPVHMWIDNLVRQTTDSPRTMNGFGSGNSMIFLTDRSRYVSSLPSPSETRPETSSTCPVVHSLPVGPHCLHLISCFIGFITRFK